MSKIRGIAFCDFKRSSSSSRKEVMKSSMYDSTFILFSGHGTVKGWSVATLVLSSR